MLPEEALLGRLLRPGATTGPLVNNQVFPDYWPEAATPPGIVYERRPQGDYDYTHFGHLSNVRARWQFHIYTEQEDKLTALQIARAIRQDFTNYQEAFDDLTLRYCLVVDEFDNYDGRAKRPRRTVEVEVLYSQDLL